MKVRHFPAVLLALALVAPVDGLEPPTRPLAGTEWRLVELQSMDDAIGTRRPPNPSVFTMRLEPDGNVRFRLDCNRATGSWTAEAGADPASGRFTFGPLAGTRALCPPPSLDEQVLAQAPHVRSYLLKDGRLHLSLMADAGIQVWEPLGDVPFAPTPDPELEAAIRPGEPPAAARVTPQRAVRRSSSVTVRPSSATRRESGQRAASRSASAR